MLKYIMEKEIKAHLLDFKLYPIVAIMLLMFIVNGIYFSNEYRQHHDYYDRQQENRSQVDYMRIYQLDPNPLSFINAANEKQASVSFVCWIEYFETDQKNGETGNIFLPETVSPDWTFIVTVLFSLLMIVLSYNSISEEIEQKTLLLNCANALSRLELYLGKFLSMLLIAAVILIFSMLCGLTAIVLIRVIPFNPAFIGSITVFSLLSLLYASLFLIIGMGFSSMLKNSTLSLIVSMTAWLFLIILLPEGLDVLVQRTQKSPSAHEIAQMAEAIKFGHMNDIFIFNRENRDHENLDENEKNRLIGQLTDDFIVLGDRHAAKEQKLSDSIVDIYRQRYMERQHLKKLSPAVLFRDIVEKSLYSGNHRFLDSLDQVRRFESLFQDDIFKRYGVRRRDYENATVIINGEIIDIEPEKIDYGYSGLEHSFRQPGLLDSLAAAISGIAIMMMLPIILFVWSFIGFVRCDIR